MSAIIESALPSGISLTDKTIPLIAAPCNIFVTMVCHHSLGSKSWTIEDI